MNVSEDLHRWLRRILIGVDTKDLTPLEFELLNDIWTGADDATFTIEDLEKARAIVDRLKPKYPLRPWEQQP